MSAIAFSSFPINPGFAIGVYLLILFSVTSAPITNIVNDENTANEISYLPLSYNDYCQR